MMKIFKSGIIPIFGLILVTSPWFFGGVEAHKIRIGREPSGNNTANDKQNGSNSELMNMLQDATSRTLGSGQIFETLQNQIYDALSNITLIAAGLGSDIQGTVQNQTGSGGSGSGSCNQVASQLWEAVKIPIFIIAPATIIGVVLLIKIIGLIAAWIPSVTGPLFESFKHSGDSDSGGYSGGSDGWSSSPTGSGYDSAVPTSGYGPPSNLGGLSRQTSILEAIDNLANVYGSNNQNPQYSQQIPNNLAGGELANYGDQQQQQQQQEFYQGGQSLQNSAQQQVASNNYPYYYYQNPNLSPTIDYSEKVNLLGNSQQQVSGGESGAAGNKAG